MHQNEALELLIRQISVTRQKVILAKSYIREISSDTRSSEQMTLMVCRHMDAEMPTEVVLHPSVDPGPALRKAADSISWQLAACEAIWELIHSDLLIPMSTDLTSTDINLSWTTVVPGSGGYSAGWKLDDYSLSCPRLVAPPPSLASSEEQSVSNHDLFIHEMAIPNMHRQVEQALREAVKCFRYELFTACLAMLGKASEGAWLQLGESLLDAVPPEDGFKVEKQKKNLENPTVSISRKIGEVMTLFERQDLFQAVANSSGVRLQDLRNVAIWSDAIRDSRNTVHFGVEPAISNTYEKVAALLIGAVPFFRVLYRIKGAADSFARSDRETD